MSDSTVSPEVFSTPITDIVTRVLDTGPQFNDQLAVDAFRWTSMTPDTRATLEHDAFRQQIAGVAESLASLAETPEQLAVLERELTAYKDRYLTMLNAWLSAHSRTASTFVTGAAKFNHRRNAKANTTEGKRLDELIAWSKAAQQRMRDALIAARTSDQIDADNWRRLKQAIDENLIALVKIDRGEGHYRGYLPNAFRNSITQSIKNTHKRGDQALVDRALAYVAERQTALGIVAASPRHAVWKLATPKAA